MGTAVATDPSEGRKKQTRFRRGQSPASLNALTRKGKGRPPLPPDQSRSVRYLTLENAAWNGWVDLAESQNLSVSRLLERITECASWLLEPVENWIRPDRLAQINLSETQARALPLITVLGLSYGHQSRPAKGGSVKRSGQSSRAEKLTGSGSKKHNLRISHTGWTGLETLALGVGRSEAETINLLGHHTTLLHRPLSNWLEKPTESVVRQIVAITD